MPVCIERLRLARSLQEVSSELSRILELELLYLDDGDLLRVAELEPSVKQVEQRYRDTVDAFKRHVSKHGCVGTKSAARG
jgi:hypothetical protein